MRKDLVTLCLVAIFSTTGMLAISTSVRGNDGDKRPSIKDVMKKAHKKPDELLKKVANGTASAEQKEELLRLYKAMAEATPPKGDAESWKEKTRHLVEAADAAVKGGPDAGKRLMAASNCMACHQDHK